ncbi:MAG: hypothetical protein LC790_10120, partial [Actinobacteria bacterium]|nr:hypothetical protein [Actinomycetota bacterium]
LESVFDPRATNETGRAADQAAPGGRNTGRENPTCGVWGAPSDTNFSDRPIAFANESQTPRLVDAFNPY